MAKDEVKARLAPVPVYTVANPKNEFVLVAGEVSCHSSCERGHRGRVTGLRVCQRHGVRVIADCSGAMRYAVQLPRCPHGDLGYELISAPMGLSVPARHRARGIKYKPAPSAMHAGSGSSCVQLAVAAPSGGRSKAASI